jgi:hypothetical protein
MKKIALIAALALAMPAWAQDTKPPAEAPKAEAPKAEAPKAEAPKAEAPKADTAKAPKSPRKPGPHRQEDARHCLEKGSNSEIIKCAEAYL